MAKQPLITVVMPAIGGLIQDKFLHNKQKAICMRAKI